MSVDTPSTENDQVPVITTTTTSTDGDNTLTRSTSTSEPNSDSHSHSHSHSLEHFEGKAEQSVILGPVDPTLPTVTPIGGYTSIPQIIPGRRAGSVVAEGDVDEQEGDDNEREVGHGDEVGAGDELDVPGARDERRKTRPESYMTALTRLNSKDREQDEQEQEQEQEQDDQVERGVAGEVGGDAVDGAAAEAQGVEPDSTGSAVNPATMTTTELPSTSILKNPQDPSLDPRPTPLPRPSVVHNFPQDDSPPTNTRLSTSKGQKEKEKTTLSLKTWWKNFSSPSSGSGSGSGGGFNKSASGGAGAGARARKGSMGEVWGEGEVFARPLERSLRYASVQISTARSDGGLFVWGYVPVVVAKCGLYLKDTATEVPGTFRVSGSAKRMKELQAVFDNGPKYGKNLDWKKTSYTTHDVATILRRYLTQMPEPIIPHELYHDFRNNLLNCRAHNPAAENSLAQTIKTYQNLIAKMPKPNQYLLLYVLDLLSVFARKSEVNLMTAPNLAVIFQPGIISHTEHEMRPAEHTLSQAVLEFLIEHQDHFLVGMQLEPVASRSSDAAGSSSEVFHPAASVVTPSIEREDRDITIVTSSLASPTSPNMVAAEKLAPISSRVESSVPSASKSAVTVPPTAPTTVAAPTSPTPVAPASPAPVVPRAPQPVRADSDLMVPSDSDDEAPVGGYYVKSEDPSRMQASITGAGVMRSRTVTDRRSPRAIPIVQEYESEPIQRDEPKPMLTGIKAPGPLRLNAPSGSGSSGAGGGLRAALSVRRGSRSQRAVSNDKHPATASSSQKAPPGVIIVDNPPFHGGVEGTPSGSRLFRRRTAPTRRNRNKDEEDAIRKQAEAAVKKLGTGTPTKKRVAAEV